MYFKLQDLENFYGVYLSDSPTQSVNYQVVNKLNKVKHNHLMLSLNKTKSIDEIKSFVGDKDYICMAKLDGLTCSLRYVDGKLVSAETRGNGIEGEDVLHNVLQIKNVPKKINYKEELIIDGEIICTYKNFKPFEKEYKNPRNFAAGSIRLLDSKESAMRNLSFVAWDLIKGKKVVDFINFEGKDERENLLDKLIALKLLNFSIVPLRIKTELTTLDEDIQYTKNFSEDMGYPIDGLVFKYNYCDEYNTAGRTDHHYKGGLSLKFYDEEYETTLQNIEWTMGRTGILTPVAIFEPIDIDGTEVSRANLHNVSILKETLHGYGWQGQKIKVAKMNMIIPQIVAAENELGQF